jgi:Phosphotransferase enzyme family
MQPQSKRPPDKLLASIGARPDAVVPIEPGFSGARVWRVGTTGGDRAVKAWPQGVTVDRIASVHRLQAIAAPCVPLLDAIGDATWMVDGDRIWESASWIPGAPLPVDATLEQILGGIRTITSFHKKVYRVHAAFGIAPAISNRISAARTIEQTIHQWSPSSDSSLPSSIQNVLRLAIERTRRDGPRAMRQIQESMRYHAQHPLPLSWCLRDIHREHLLDDRGQSGIIDLDAVRVDTPATDLSRWLGSFCVSGDGAPQVIAAAVDRWADQMENRTFLGSAPVRLISDLLWSTAWISLAQWSIWIGCEKRTFEVSAENLRQRIGFWLDRVNSLPPLR